MRFCQIFIANPTTAKNVAPINPTVIQLGTFHVKMTDSLAMFHLMWFARDNYSRLVLLFGRKTVHVLKRNEFAVRASVPEMQSLARHHER